VRMSECVLGLVEPLSDADLARPTRTKLAAADCQVVGAIGEFSNGQRVGVLAQPAITVWQEENSRVQ